VSILGFCGSVHSYTSDNDAKWPTGQAFEEICFK